MNEQVDGRTRRKLAAMVRVQEVALGLFEAKGFAAVTIEDIARAAEVGPATVYRNFGTKERVVLWDEYDPQLFGALEVRLGKGRPLTVVREVLLESVARFDGPESRRILRRARLTAAVPALARESLVGLSALRSGLAEVLRRRGGVKAPLEAEVLSAAAVGALEAAIGKWVALGARRDLGALVAQAFAVLDRFAAAPARARRS